MLKFGTKHVPSVSGVIIKRANIAHILRLNVIFGEAKTKDLSTQLQVPTTSRPTNNSGFMMWAREIPTGRCCCCFSSNDEDGVVNDSGVQPRDIELVMIQVSVSQGKAIKALKATNDDIVSAIMDLTN